LVDVAYAFFARDPDAPIAVTDRYLAGYLFVMCGGADDISGLLKKRVMANCSNAVAPRTDLIEKMAGFVETLDESDRKKYTAMMTDGRAGRYLTEITFGNTGYLQANNFEGVLTEIYEEAFVERKKALVAQSENFEVERQRLTAEMAIGHERAVDAVRQETAQALRRVDEQFERLAREQEAREKAEADLNRAQSQLQTTLSRLAADAFGSGQTMRRLLYVGYALAAFVLAWLGDLIAPASNYRFVIYLCSAVLLMVTLHQVPRVLIDRPQVAFTRWRYRRAVERLGLSAPAEGFVFDAATGVLGPGNPEHGSRTGR
jgi:hypothetical protein